MVSFFFQNWTFEIKPALHKCSQLRCDAQNENFPWIKIKDSQKSTNEKLCINIFRKVLFSTYWLQLINQVSYQLLTVVSISITRVTKGSKLRISTTRWGRRSKIALKTPPVISRQIFWCNTNS